FATPCVFGSPEVSYLFSRLRATRRFWSRLFAKRELVLHFPTRLQNSCSRCWPTGSAPQKSPEAKQHASDRPSVRLRWLRASLRLRRRSRDALSGSSPATGE